MGWDGDEAIAGLNKLADATQKTGQEIDDLAIKQKRAAAEQKAFEKRLEGMNALERQAAILARETKQRRMGMTAGQIENEIKQEQIKKQKEASYESLKERLRGMNALEREEYKAAERKKKLVMSMTADQIRQEQENAKKLAEQAKKRDQKESAFAALKDRLRGMNALERQEFKNQEREKKRLSTMSAAEITKEIEDKRIAKEKSSSFEALKNKLRGMNALEREEFKEEERKKSRRMKMSAEQIRAEIDAEKKGEEAKAAQAKKAADKAAAWQEWRNKSLFQKAAHLTSGAADIRAAGGMVYGAASGVANGAVQFAQMGAELESMQIRAAYLAGSFAKGTKAIEDMRQASMASGIALKENVAAMTQMANAGISMEASTRTVQQASAAAELLGENGMASISGSISALFKAGTASSGELDALQSQGIHVYEELAKVLENTTGKTHSLEEAMGAVREGAVSSGEAVRAVMAASNNQEMQDAAARFAGSFEGQVRRLKTTMEDTFREISKLFLDSFDITSIAAGLRGAFMAIRDIVKEIANTFLPVIDPKDKAKGVENTFRAMRDIVYDLAERMANAVIDLRQAFETLLPIIEANINKFMKRMEFGLSGIFAGDEINRFYESEDAVARMKGRGAATRADAAKAGVGKFFGDVRAGAAARDAANIAKPAERIAEANRKLENRAGDAALALETMAKSASKFAVDTMAQMRTPFEQFNFEVKNLAKSWDEADQAAKNKLMTGDELSKFRDAATRKGGRLLQDLIANNIGGESQFSSGAIRGSAAEVEMRVRAQYGEETMSIQEKIRIATERAAFNSDKQLAYSAALVDAFGKQKNPPTAQMSK
jgi:hypothetical protein